MIVVQVLPLAKSIPWKITNMTLNKERKDDDPHNGCSSLTGDSFPSDHRSHQSREQIGYQDSSQHIRTAGIKINENRPLIT